MVLFYILAAVLTLLAAAWLAWPLLRRMDAPAGAAEHGQAVYRDQLTELERDVARGVLSAGEEAAVRAEIARRMLASGRRAAPEPKPGMSQPLRIAAILVVIAPLAAVALYAFVGRPGAPDRPLAARLAAGETQQTAADAEMESALAELSAEVRRNPDNFETRLLLGRVLFRMGRYDEAIEHYARAAELTDAANNVQVLSEYAQTRIMAAGSVDAESFELLRRVIEADPENPEARFFLGLALAQYGEYRLAQRMWEDLMADLPPDAPWTGVLREQLDIVRGQAAAQAAGQTPDDTAPADPAPAAPQ